MQYSPRLDDLKVLNCFLKDQLHAHMGRIVPFSVQCVFKDGVLWVLSEHPPEIVIDTEETFHVLEKILQAEEPVVELPVRLYLRTVGQKQPYSTENFSIYPVVSDRQPVELKSIDKAEAQTSAQNTTAAISLKRSQPPPILDKFAGNSSAKSTANLTEDTLNDEVTIEQMSLANNNPNTDQNTDSDRVESHADEVEDLADNVEGDFSSVNSTPPKAKKTGLLIGSGLGLAAVGLGVFAITRPCVLGACPQLQQSHQLAEKSLATLNPAVTGKELQAAQSNLRQSITNLKTVPFWSGSYAQAQTDLKNYERQSTMLDLAVAGIDKAERAAEPTQKQPVTQTAWQESQKLWEGAISDLEKVSTDSQVYPLAQQKQGEYQQKLDSVKQNITSEVNASKSLDSAKVLSLATSQKQPQAQSLEQWQALQKDWKTMIGLINDIPAGSSAYPEAQTLKKLYEPQILIVNAKLEKEKVAGDFSQKSETAAQVAKKFQKDQKLDESLSQWNNAIALLQKIPNDSIYQATAQKRIPEYNAAMQKVINTKNQAQADKDLKQTCEGKPQVCSYQVADKAITVKLLPEYTQTVRKTALEANTQGDNNAKIGLIKHLQSLGTALEAVSDNSRIPIQLYLENGKLMQSYTPRKS
jgi:hypothetical protein